MNRVFLGIGSNRGNRLSYINKSIKNLSRYFVINKISKIIETEPLGPPQMKYLNLVVEILTLYSPFTVLEKLKKIEKKLAREKFQKWGSRTIDIDILFYNDEVISTPLLCIPHKEIGRRNFVLEPLCQINPSFIHPTLKKTCKELLDDLKREAQQKELKNGSM